MRLFLLKCPLHCVGYPLFWFMLETSEILLKTESEKRARLVELALLLFRANMNDPKNKVLRREAFELVRELGGVGSEAWDAALQEQMLLEFQFQTIKKRDSYPTGFLDVTAKRSTSGQGKSEDNYALFYPRGIREQVGKPLSEIDREVLSVCISIGARVRQIAQETGRSTMTVVEAVAAYEVFGRTINDEIREVVEHKITGHTYEIRL